MVRIMAMRKCLLHQSPRARRIMQSYELEAELVGTDSAARTDPRATKRLPYQVTNPGDLRVIWRSHPLQHWHLLLEIARNFLCDFNLSLLIDSNIISQRFII